MGNIFGTTRDTENLIPDLESTVFSVSIWFSLTEKMNFSISTPSPLKMTLKLANITKNGILSEMGIFILAIVPIKERIRDEGLLKYND